MFKLLGLTTLPLRLMVVIGIPVAIIALIIYLT